MQILKHFITDFQISPNRMVFIETASNEAQDMSSHYLQTYTVRVAIEALDRYLEENKEVKILFAKDGDGLRREDIILSISKQLSEFISKNRSVIDAIIQNSINADDADGYMRKLAEGYAYDEARTQCTVSRLNVDKEKLIIEANKDELTGIGNRKAYNERLRLAIEMNNRFKHDAHLLMIDGDKFKEVNDNYGYQAGDTVIKEMARRIKIRNADSVSRWGGDEFAVILSNTDYKGACIVALRIAKAIEKEPFKIKDREGNDHEIKMTSSIGLAEYTSGAEDPDGTLFQNSADASLKYLKQENNGQNKGKIAFNGEVVSEDKIIEWATKHTPLVSIIPKSDPPKPFIDKEI
ncbi:GGDEF domain-containing protein [Candidatus Peregrinibacteria bacterium]|nr:GGDEF domain-containing protein [Candidatus Peregrinibacteria bacterium]